ncbi:OB-fold nucleic acid binding domain-containing protein [Candidatus Nanohalococcus occultus]|uniref:OB-fold nucleic acid binding domain-containing protein n=1 Tax=Candidatus Nanohalococcus occultus TaxID=2978047 RepID=UPI0039E1B33A
MPQQERQTAKLTTAEELHSGRYFEKEGFTPNYLLTPGGRKISRTRLVGTVVDSFINDDETYASITIDDGTDTVQLKFFNELDQMREFEIGDIIEAIGKVREYQGQIYLNAEILENCSVEKELLHQLRHRKQAEEWKSIHETVKQMKEAGKDQDEIEKEMAGKLKEDEVDALLQSFGEDFGNIDTEAKDNLEQDVIEAVEEIDEGDGADYSEIAEEVDADEDQLEDTINSLLSEGTFYEPQPGKIKKL